MDDPEDSFLRSLRNLGIGQILAGISLLAACVGVGIFLLIQNF